MLIRQTRESFKFQPIPRKSKAEGWQMYRCSCCGEKRSRWVERGEIIETQVNGYCPESKNWNHSEVMEIYGE